MPATYEPIASQTVPSSTASVTFSSIPGTYTDLVLVIVGGTDSQGDNIRIRFNSDTGTNYSTTHLSGNGSSATSNRASSQAAISVSYNVGGGSDLAQHYVVNVMSYANANVFKTTLSTVSQPNGSTSYPGIEKIVGLWRSTSAITSIDVIRTGGGNLLTNSVLSLYGIKAA